MDQNLHWFKKGIKPVWEDPKNKHGGRLTLSPPRALLDIVWETVLVLMAGDVLDFNGEATGAGTYRSGLFMWIEERWGGSANARTNGNFFIFGVVALTLSYYRSDCSE